MKTNFILNSDSYKYSHYKQLPPGAEYVNSYIEARGCDDPNYNEVMFFGLQAFIKEYLMTPITREDVEEAKSIIEAHGEPFNYDGWMRIVTEHGGFMPVHIESVDEGTIIPLRMMMVQVRNTDPMLPWAAAFVETSLLRAVWYPTSVATVSWKIRQMLKAYAEKSGATEGVDFKLHDFGARGVSSNESAMLGGMAHLATGAMGTDTVMALVGAQRYYDEPMAGYSIPAAEHSTITAWGEDGEVDAYRNMLKQFAKPNSLVAVVSDSYDIFNAVDNIWGKELKQDVIDSGATVVIRPDSGNPVEVVRDVICLLMKNYGFTVNEKGYKTLPSCIRVIQGDGINRDSIEEILRMMDANRFSLDNVAFGMGGALLQHMNRDTFKFAQKTSSINFDGVEVDVFKNPVGDATKASKRGILDTIRMTSGGFITVRKPMDQTPFFRYPSSIMRTRYKNGSIHNIQTFSDIRKKANEE